MHPIGFELATTDDPGLKYVACSKYIMERADAALLAMEKADALAKAIPPDRPQPEHDAVAILCGNALLDEDAATELLSTLCLVDATEATEVEQLAQAVAQDSIYHAAQIEALKAIQVLITTHGEGWREQAAGSCFPEKR